MEINTKITVTCTSKDGMNNIQVVADKNASFSETVTVLRQAYEMQLNIFKNYITEKFPDAEPSEEEWTRLFKTMKLEDFA